ncbi:hypothetical protein [Phenylobacterium montanum]|uniref:Uncharacterized protein n=1 Tax=Phenylobacterium montanum TaxID=2823693 RepID=A0A975FZ19_9CAUL|nr:hypothetical protein [Caulobacter sp. S6]QUD88055.1 hypothetical protein KCG34_23990 [Caulobacter sp. S6]
MQLEANFESAVAILKAAGVRVWAVTIGTETTTTDGGATTGNQTPVPGFAPGGAGQAYNDWLRTTGAPTYTGGRILDEADAEMSSRDSQLWRVDYHPFADWFGSLIAVSFVPGSGGMNGSYNITATGGGCLVEPVVQATVSGGAISAVSTTNVGAGCGSTPSFSTSAIAGLSGGSITATVTALRNGIHPRSLTDLTGSSVDANGLVATYLQSQFVSGLALP